MSAATAVRGSLIAISDAVEPAKPTDGGAIVDPAIISQAEFVAVQRARSMQNPVIVNELVSELEWDDEQKLEWLDWCNGLEILATRAQWTLIDIQVDSMAGMLAAEAA